MEAFNPSIYIPYPYTMTSNIGTSSHCSSASSSANIIISSSWMDSGIWSKLPQRLLDRVIAFLPPPAFFRARSVCKRWYGLLFSSSFLELYLHVSRPHHWFIFFKQKATKSYIYKSNSSSSNNDNNSGGSTANCEGYLFDPTTMSWYRLSFALIPSGFSPACSSGGLVSWVSDESGPKSLLLYNPLLGTLSQLPPTSRPRLCPSIGLHVTSTSIDVAVAGDDMISPYAVKNLTTESFHIDGAGFYSLWGINSTLPRLCSLESGRMVYAHGTYFCMNSSPYSVLKYDVGTNHWSKIQAPMRRFLRSPNLIENRGKLVLVAAVEKSKLNVPKSLRLWCLQSCGTTWIEMERMPQQLYVEFEEVEGGRGFDCVGHGEFVMVVIRGGGSNKAVLFDVCSKSWVWIPPCPYVHCGFGSGGGCAGEEEGGSLHGFAYEPRLAAPITSLLDQLALPFQTFHG